jgi:hypothetical protein
MNGTTQVPTLWKAFTDSHLPPISNMHDLVIAFVNSGSKPSFTFLVEQNARMPASGCHSGAFVINASSSMTRAGE